MGKPVHPAHRAAVFLCSPARLQTDCGARIGASRRQVFLVGQCMPFVFTKVRHFFVTWARSIPMFKYLFYHLLTSHVEIGCNLFCDTVVLGALLHDWLTSASNDLRLRVDMNRLRSGYFTIASISRPEVAGNGRTNARRPHAD